MANSFHSSCTWEGGGEIKIHQVGCRPGWACYVQIRPDPSVPRRGQMDKPSDQLSTDHTRMHARHWGRGPNTHWVHGKNIESAVNMWLQCAQQSNVEHILNIPCHVTPICPVGTCWVHFECAQPCDSNVPSGQTIGHILNVPSHVTPMYPVGKQSGTFWMFGEIQSQCAQWVIYMCSKNV